MTSDPYLCIKGAWLTQPDFLKKSRYNHSAFLRSEIGPPTKVLAETQITGKILNVKPNPDGLELKIED